MVLLTDGASYPTFILCFFAIQNVDERRRMYVLFFVVMTDDDDDSIRASPRLRLLLGHLARHRNWTSRSMPIDRNILIDAMVDIKSHSDNDFGLSPSAYTVVFRAPLHTLRAGGPCPPRPGWGDTHLFDRHDSSDTIRRPNGASWGYLIMTRAFRSLDTIKSFGIQDSR
jgi:hypothetical protein